MISRNSKALIFFRETTLVNVHAQLSATADARLEYVNNTCSPALQTFYNNILHSYRVMQGVIQRLSSLQGVTNLMECDKYLRRFYRYSTGRTPTMVCPRSYHGSLQECKTWALKEQYPVTAHAQNFDFWTGCREIKRCEESKRILKNPFASRLAGFNTTLKLLRITDQ